MSCLLQIYLLKEIESYPWRKEESPAGCNWVSFGGVERASTTQKVSGSPDSKSES